jgi:hypothetical protein
VRLNLKYGVIECSFKTRLDLRVHQATLKRLTNSAHWQEHRKGLKSLLRRALYTHTPGNNKYLVNYHVVLLGESSPPPGLQTVENRAFEANFTENHPDYKFYTSEHNDGHENRFCRNGDYNPDEVRPPTGRELWRRWQFVYTGNDRVPFWIVRVPQEIIWGHGGLWSDSSVALCGKFLPTLRQGRGKGECQRQWK